jgi:hypothetical protein
VVLMVLMPGGGGGRGLLYGDEDLGQASAVDSGSRWTFVGFLMGEDMEEEGESFLLCVTRTSVTTFTAP